MILMIEMPSQTGDVVDFIEQTLVVGRRADEVVGDFPATLDESRMQHGSTVGRVPQLWIGQREMERVNALALLSDTRHVVAADGVQQRPAEHVSVLLGLARRSR